MANDLWFKRDTPDTTNSILPLTWTVATRPASPADGTTGLNTDFYGLETYDSNVSKWTIHSGRWTTATRPATANIAKGSVGFNTDTGFGLEFWDGSNWRLV